MEIYIIIPVHNRKDFTRVCLNSIRKQTFKDFEIIVIDDGSTDGTDVMLREEFPEVHVIHGNGNWWWTKSVNEGVKYSLRSDAHHILTLNNDLIVKKDYLESLIRLNRDNKKSIIGSVSVDIRNPENIQFCGVKWNSIHAKYTKINEKSISYSELKNNIGLTHTDLLPGRGTLIPSKVFNQIGLYDEKNFPHYAADEDFSLRAKNKGWDLLISTGSVVYSHVNETELRLSRNMNICDFINSLRSIKSPTNLYTRYNWSRIHGKIPILYFSFDIARIIFSFILKDQKYR